MILASAPSRARQVWDGLFDLAERHAEAGRTDLLITGLDQSELNDFAYEIGSGHPVRVFDTIYGPVALVSS